MKMSVVCGVIAVLTAVTTSAQVVIPRSAEGVEQVFGSGTFDTAHRSQQVYGSVEFPQYPISIHEFRFRPDSVHGGAFTATVANIQINLSTTQRRPDALSSTFSDNVGSDDTIVYQGPLTISSRFTGGSPKDFDIIVQLQQPYLYDPANGNLVIDTRNFSGSSAPRLGGQNAADVASRVLGGITASSGTPDSGADAIQVWFTSEPTPPVIVTEPSNRTVVEGSSVTFSVGASGSAPLAYQWQFNGTNIDGATFSSLTLGNVQFSHAGNYSVNVTNEYGTAQSQAALLTVISNDSSGLQLVIPRVNETLDGSATDGGGSGVLNHAIRQQIIYGVSQFPLGRIVIRQLRMRPSAVWGNAFTSTIPNLQINMSTTAAQPNNLSPTFADNVGADDTVVFQGPISLSSQFTGPAGGPKDFDIIIPLATPFAYDSAVGNLLIDVRNASGSTVTHVDAGGAPDDNCSRAFALSASATTATTRDKGAEVFQLIYSAEPTPPVILTQPSNRTVLEGSSVTFSVGASGSAPLAYQWQFNGTNIDGATFSSLTLGNVQFSHAGNYSVNVTNEYGAVASDAAMLTVNPRPPPADYDLSGDFALDSNPNGVWTYGWLSTLAGEFTTLGTAKTTTAENGVPIQVWAISLSSAPAIFHNATSTTATSDGGQAVLPPGTTWFGAGPDGSQENFCVIRFTVPNGGDGTYSIDASVAPVYNRTQGDTDFHILKNGAEVFAIALTGQAASRHTNELTLAAGDVIDFVIGRGADNSYHYSSLKIQALLNLISTNPAPPTIVSQPQSQTVEVGATVTLGVGVNGSVPLSYQWQFNGTDIPEGTNSTLILEFVQSSDAGDYQVLVRNDYGSATSTVATVTVHSSGVAPTISSQPANAQVIAGSSVTLSAQALGTAPLNYQWYYNGLILTGATFSSLVLTNIQTSQSGTYWVIVTNAFGSATSRGAVVNVWASTGGGMVRFFNGTNALIYDVDGSTPLPAGHQYLAQLYAGPDASSLEPIGAAVGFAVAGRFFQGTRTITSVPAGQVATVQVRAWQTAYGTSYEQALATGGKTGASDIFTVVTGGAGSPPSFPAELTGLQRFSLMPGVGTTPPRITTQPASQTILLGQNASFQVTADGVAPLLYQWRLNGAEIPGATASALTITNAGNADAGDYFVVVRNNGGAVTSDVATLTIETERLLVTDNIGAAAEGELITVPINLISKGDVGGMTFVLRYNPDYLSAPAVTWGSVLDGALKEFNESTLGELRFVFAFGSATVPAGTQSLAVVNLRARSIIEAGASPLVLQIIDVSDVSGNPIIYGTAAQSGSVGIVSTSSLEGDNNGNGTLDVGDATLLLRLLTQLDTTRSWDVDQNDLNNNGVLDSGDAIKIIRAAAGIGTPPPAPLLSSRAQAKGITASSLIAGSATLAPETLRGNPNSLVTLQLRLQGLTSPIAGASFTINYPANVLRFRAAQDHRTGALVPRNAVPIWNVSPSQNNYATQDGQLRFAVSSSTPWPANNGVLAELTFQVQNPPAGEFSWPITVSNVQITPDGYDLAALPSTGARFTVQPELSGASRSAGGGFTFTFGAGGIGSFAVEASTNLVDWVVLTNVVNASGTVLISDPAAAQLPQRYYRTRIAD